MKCEALPAAREESGGYGAEQHDIKISPQKWVAASGYDDESVEIKAGAHQIEVVLMNSKILSGSRAARVTEAERIAGAVARTIAGKAEFSSVEGVHVDYIARKTPGGHVDRVDAIDFRKDPDGNFRHHIS